jgi:hypothetical protein
MEIAWGGSIADILRSLGLAAQDCLQKAAKNR